MKLFSFLCTLLVLATINASPLNLETEDGWTWVPTRSGIPMPVKVASAFSGPQLLFNVESDVVFELYTLKNKKQPQILKPGNVSSVTSSNFNQSLPTRIYIHGWQEWAGNMKNYFNDAYLERAKLNVNLIAVNWEASSRTLDYIGSAGRVEPIGIYVAKLIDFMVANKLVSLKDIHVIGFSLGAHAAGYAGKNVKSGKLEKIVGLDPAGPLFKKKDAKLRLDKSDAKYVEVVHTCGYWLGIYDPIGSTNFYPNHGKKQSGWRCWLDVTGTCSHYRAFKYFAESIYAPVKFDSMACKTFEAMEKSQCAGNLTHLGGEPGNYRNDASIYYLETNGQSLFAKKWF